MTTTKNPAPHIIVPRNVPRGIVAVANPAVLPGGSAALVTIWKGEGSVQQEEIAVASLVDGSITELGLAGTVARYAAGLLIFTRGDGSLNSVAFSPRLRRIRGSVTQLVPSVIIKLNGSADFDVSDDGTIAYVGGSEARRYLSLVDRAGHAQRLGGGAQRFFTPRFSRDGQSIAVEVGSMSGFDIWTYDLRMKSLAAITADGRAIRPGDWSSDGSVLFLGVSPTLTRTSIRSRSPDGRIDRKLVPDSAWIDEVAVGGRFFAYRAKGTIKMATLDGPDSSNVIVTRERRPRTMRLSRDARFVAYQSAATSPPEIIVQGTDSRAGAVQISAGGGDEPVWSPRGDEVFYRANSRLIAARLAFDPLRVVRRDTLFRDTYLRGTFTANYDVAPDNEHFVMIENEKPDVYPTVLVNKLRIKR